MSIQMRDDVEPKAISPAAFEVARDRPPEPAEAPRLGLCANQPNGGPVNLAAPSDADAPTKAMADTALLWPLGKELQVYFLNGTDAWGQAIRQAVEAIAPLWSKYANIRFKVTDQPVAHITVNLLPYGQSVTYGSYSSYLGKDCLAALSRNPPIPSMNLVFPPELQGQPAVRDSEFHRVILHEFGHALGMIHEHQRPDRPIQWDVPALNAYCSANFGWSSQTVQQQIIDQYVPRAQNSMLGGGFDPRSIMMYQYPPGIARYADGSAFETPNNTALTPLDKVVANMLYPATGVTDPAEVAFVAGDPPIAGSIGKVGQVARYRFMPTKAGDHVIQARGDAPLLVSLLTKRGNPGGRMLAAEGQDVSLAFHPLQFNDPYFIEVRHAEPMVGTGNFSIAVRPPG